MTHYEIFVVVYTALITLVGLYGLINLLGSSDQPGKSNTFLAKTLRFTARGSIVVIVITIFVVAVGSFVDGLEVLANLFSKGN